MTEPTDELRPELQSEIDSLVDKVVQLAQIDDRRTRIASFELVLAPYSKDVVVLILAALARAVF